MPMTTEESRATVEIMLRYLSPREARAWALDMWHEVGEKTDNSSVRETLDSIRQLAESQQLPNLAKRIYAGWLIVFVTHWAIALGNLAGCSWLLVCAVTSFEAPDWAVALPLATFVVWTLSSRAYDCPLTVLEDKYRGHYGLPSVKAFLGHYLVRPIRRAWSAEPAGNKAPVVKNADST